MYSLSLSIETTLDPCAVDGLSFHSLDGLILIRVSALVGSAQTTQGPVQKVETFLDALAATTGVKSHTLVPGRKDFLSKL